jgi:transposase
VIGVQQWAEIRRLYLAQGWKKRAIARHLGLQRRTVDRALASEVAPRYRRGSLPSCLDDHKPQIRSLLQRFPKLSAVRILEELRGAGYGGQVTILRDYLRQVRPEFVATPAFQRTVYLPGAIAQIDWGKMPTPVPGPDGLEEVWAFCLALGFSKYLYVGWSRRIKASDFFRHHRRALEAIGGVPQTCVYDNLKPVVVRHTRTEVLFGPAFLAFSGLYGFAPHACTPRAAYQKGTVERPIGYVKGNFWAGRDFVDFADVVRQGAEWMARANQRRHARLRARPSELWQQERAHLLALPRLPFDTDEVVFARVSKDGFVRFDTNDYSVPPGLGGQLLEIRADDQTVAVRRAGSDLVRHGRRFGKYQTIVVPAHQNLADYRAQWPPHPELLPSIPVEERDLRVYDQLVAR